MTLQLENKEGNFYYLNTYVHNDKDVLLIKGKSVIYKK